MATEMLTRPEHRAPPPVDPVPSKERSRARRVRRLQLNFVAWVLGSFLVTALWVAVEWNDNGSFESFGHEGDPGQWNPTLWTVVVGGWGLVVGTMALGVYFTGRRLQFHVAAWLLGMAVLTPLWALIEWQDNGGFERWSRSSQPGDWDPWIVTVGAIWALGIAILMTWDRRRRSRV